MDNLVNVLHIEDGDVIRRSPDACKLFIDAK